MNSVFKVDKDILDETVQWRRHLHANPETAFDEVETSNFIASKLQEHGIEVARGVGETGLVGTLKRGSGNRAVGLRADMDALFIREENDVDYRSTVDGKMHACGHDGHVAMLLGAACQLARSGDFDGTVRFIFQPAEETGNERCGGNLMVKDGLFERFPVDAVFGLHNWPGIPAGRIVMRPGPMLASIDTFKLVIGSQMSHPHSQFQVADPLLVAASIVQAMHAFKARYINPAEPVVLSITQFQSGNPDDLPGVHVTPDRAVVRGTLYTLNDSIRDAFEAALSGIVRHTAEAAGASHEFIFDRGYPVLMNDPAETKFIAEVAGEIVGTGSVVSDMQPVMGAEDFAFMLQKAPGCYVFLGASRDEEEAHGLHTPRYDFNDDIIETGIRYWGHVAERYLAVDPRDRAPHRQAVTRLETPAAQ